SACGSFAAANQTAPGGNLEDLAAPLQSSLPPFAPASRRKNSRMPTPLERSPIFRRNQVSMKDRDRPFFARSNSYLNLWPSFQFQNASKQRSILRTMS